MTALRPQLFTRAAVAFLCCSLLFVLASPASAQVVLRRGNTSEPDTLDPQKASGQWENHIISDMFVGLTTYAANGDSVYGAAETHTVSDDGLVWTFKIREGHRWSDGKPVTAHDFVYAYRRINDPETAAQYAAITYPIKNAQAVNEGTMPIEAIGARAVDDQILELTLEHPAPYLFQALSHYAFYPVPKHVVEQHRNKWTDADKMVTNGAYRLIEWRPNEHVRTGKNPYFYDADEVQIDEVYFVPIMDSEAALKRFRAGELDLNNDFPLPQLDWLKANMPGETRIAPFILAQYVVFNMTRPPFDDARVREALGLAIDRETLVERVLRAGQVPAYALVPPGISGYPGTAQLRYKDMPLEQRRARARELLAQAGYSEGNRLSATYIHQSTVEARRVAVALQDMWRQVGAEIKLQSAESKVHYTNLRRQNYDLGWGGWIADFNDARNYLFLAETRSADMNYSKYSSPEFDNLLTQSDMELDPAKRAQIMAAAEQVMLDDGPMAPVFFGTSRNLVQKWVKGWEANPLDVHRTRWMRIDGRTQAVSAATPLQGTASDGAQVKTDGERSWGEWFSGITCSWFGMWCTA